MSLVRRPIFQYDFIPQILPQPNPRLPPPKQFQGLGCGKGLISIHLHDLFIACSDLRIRLCTEEETSAGQPVQTSRRISSWLNYNGVVSVVNQPWSFVSLGT